MRDVGRAGLHRVEGADIRRTGPTRATGQQCAVGAERVCDHGHASDRGNGIFPVTARELFRDSAVWRFHYT